MGINVNMDYSTLFGSLPGANSSNNIMSGLSGMLSDYSSIRNGSYGKLVSAYYKKIENENSDSTDKADKSSKNRTEVLKNICLVVAHERKERELQSRRSLRELLEPLKCPISLSE